MQLKELTKEIKGELLLVPGGLTTPTAVLVEGASSPPCVSTKLPFIQLSNRNEA